MSPARYPCIECGTPFDTDQLRYDHWVGEGHGPEQVQADAIDRARLSVMGDAAPEPKSVYRGHVQAQRRRLRTIPGGRAI